MFKGTLQTCVDFLARYDSSLWSEIFVLIHVPAWHCYAAMPIAEHYDFQQKHPNVASRLIFQGSIIEMAHFVLCPPLTHHATRQTLPELMDNEPHADYPEIVAATVIADIDTGTQTKITTKRTAGGNGNGDTA